MIHTSPRRGIETLELIAIGDVLYVVRREGGHKTVEVIQEPETEGNTHEN